MKLKFFLYIIILKKLNLLKNEKKIKINNNSLKKNIKINNINKKRYKIIKRILNNKKYIDSNSFINNSIINENIIKNKKEIFIELNLSNPYKMVDELDKLEGQNFNSNNDRVINKNKGNLIYLGYITESFYDFIQKVFFIFIFLYILFLNIFLIYMWNKRRRRRINSNRIFHMRIV